MPYIDQTFPRQPLDRLAHRGAPEAQPGYQRAFGGNAARRQFERDDHPFKRPVGLCRDGLEYECLGLSSQTDLQHIFWVAP